MLRMSVAEEEYLMIGENIRIVFLGSSGKHTRIMIDAPREVEIVRSRVLEKKIKDPEMREKLPKFYKEEEHPEKYKPRKVFLSNGSEAPRGRNDGTGKRERQPRQHDGRQVSR